MPSITEGWLRDAGFKYSTPDRRQPEKKHWTLWFGDCIPECSGDELGIEVAYCHDGSWFCWLRSDLAHRYSRFIHLRHIRSDNELITLIEGITGQSWDVANNYFGVMRSPKTAAQFRADSARFDRHLVESNCPWDTTERDPDLAKPSHNDRRIANGGKRIMGGQECAD